MFTSSETSQFVTHYYLRYRCQYYGHVAAVCRREVARCGKYAEGHETKECVALGKVVVCVNCRGAHGVEDQKCPVQRGRFRFLGFE